MQFIDLFCGIGGFRFGLESLGYKCVLSCDIDEHCRNCYEDNFGDRPYGDICSIKLKDIPKHDILCAGFPCQPFSISGKQGGFNDSRSLFFEIARIVNSKKPKVVFLENVKNIVTMKNGGIHDTICNSLQDLGYKINWDVLNASHYGVPQSRRRAYYVCIGNRSGIKYTTPVPTYDEIYLESVLDLTYKSSDELVDGKPHRIHITKQNDQYKLAPIRIGHINKAHQGERIYDPKGHAITLSASTGGRGRGTGLYRIQDSIRRLNVYEAARVMGFPDELKIRDTPQSFKQLGNAIIPSIVKRIGMNIQFK